MNERRADLQGLRAIAVAMVIAYHIVPAWLPGGFVGVDVFFVLSGFLITGGLNSELQRSGRVDLAAFWGRRIKRLLPNALLTLAGILLLSWLLLPAYRLENISKDVVSATLFFSNFHFAATAVDYFRFSDPPSPVLHFWSLSIEEQFYFVLPLIFLVTGITIGWSRRAATLTLAVILIASFATSLIVMQDDQPAAFFLTYARAWQLAAGGLLAVNFDARNHVGAFARGLFSNAGIGLIVLAAFWFDDDLPYLGVYGIVPTLGAVALIFGLDSSALALPLRTFLSSRVMGWVGDRSYSLYLWHWPIITFIQFWTPLDPAGMLAAAATTILVSSIAYSFVERPIHHHDTRTWKWFMVPVWSAMSIAALYGSAHALPVLPQQELSAERNTAIEIASKSFGRNYPDGCHLLYEQVAQKPCVYGKAGSPQKIVLFGDSHAAHWFNPLRHAAEVAGWELRAWTKTGCPWPDVTIWYPPKKAVYDECSKWRENTLVEIEKLKPDVVVLGTLSNYDALGLLYVDRVLDRTDAKAAWETAILSTIDRLQSVGITVAVVKDTPRIYVSYKSCLASGGSECGRDRREALKASDEFAEFILRQRAAVHQFDFSDEICDRYRCPAMRSGTILYQDEHHLTATYAETFWPVFSAYLTSKNRHSQDQAHNVQ